MVTTTIIIVVIIRIGLIANSSGFAYGSTILQPIIHIFSTYTILFFYNTTITISTSRITTATMFSICVTTRVFFYRICISMKQIRTIPYSITTIRTTTTGTRIVSITMMIHSRRTFSRTLR